MNKPVESAVEITTDTEPKAQDSDLDFAAMDLYGLDESEALAGFEVDVLQDIGDEDYEGYDFDHSVIEGESKEDTETTRKFMTFNTMEDIKDPEVLYREAAQRIALRKGLPLTPAVFGNSKNCKAFFEECIKDSPPPTAGMLDAAAKLFSHGEATGLAIIDMNRCQKYLIAKSETNKPSKETLETANRIAVWKEIEIPQIAFLSETTLIEWIKEHG